MTGRTASPDQRRRDLATIHLGKKALGLDDDAYRDMLWTVARVRSSADLNHEQRQAVIAHLRRCGFAAERFHGKPRADGEWSWVNTAAPDRQAMLWKIRRLLVNAGRRRQYADGIAEAMFRIPRLELCGARELHAIITALVKDGKRHPEGRA
ncbi:MAG: regulatory protein GemA [Burkholderiales bacterium]|nr:regulatory protein GemA [Burkholderiales bacterium]